jgi:hypothetical protein
MSDPVIPDPPTPAPNDIHMTEQEFNFSMRAFITWLYSFVPAIKAAIVVMKEYYLNAEAAAGAIGNQVWVTGTTYSIGNVRYSPIDFQNYRRKTNGAGATDPSNDPTNWTLISKTLPGGADTTSSGSDITLTSTSGRLQRIAMTSPGLKANLPSATTMLKGAPLFVFVNDGLYRYAVHKNGGVFVCYVQPGQTVMLHLSDTSSSAGLWTVSGNNVEKIYDSSTAEVLNAVDSRNQAVVVLSPTKALCVYRDNISTYINGVVINSDTASGTPVVLNAEDSVDISVAAQTSSQAVVAYKIGSGGSAGVTRGFVVNISGSTPSAPVSPVNIDGTAGGNGTDITALDTNKYLCIYRNGGAGTGIAERVLTISSNNITPASEVNAHQSNANASSHMRVRRIATTKALVASRLNTGAEIFLALQTITGTTPAPSGNALNIVTPGTNNFTNFGLVVFSAGRALVAQSIDRSRAGLMLSLIDISGSTPVLIRNKIIYLNVTAADVNVNATKLDSNNAYVAWLGGGSQGVDSLKATITGDDQILVGSVSEGVMSGVAPTAGYMSCDALDSTHVVQVSRNASTYLSAKTLELAA